MVNDHLSDLVTRVRNGYLAGKLVVEAPLTKTSKAVLEVLVSEGFLEKVEVQDGSLIITLKYKKKTPVVTGIRRVSKPGKRVYGGFRELPRVLGGLGINILSTPAGIISEKKARKLNVCGEIIAQVW